MSNVDLPLCVKAMDEHGYPFATGRLMAALARVEPFDFYQERWPTGSPIPYLAVAVQLSYPLPGIVDVRDPVWVSRELPKLLRAALTSAYFAPTNENALSGYAADLWSVLRSSWLDVLCSTCQGYGTRKGLPDGSGLAQVLGDCYACAGSGVRRGFLRVRGDAGKWFVSYEASARRVSR